MQNRAFAEEEGEDPDGTDGLAANRGERRAFASHIEAVDEYRIEDNVEGRPDEDGHHAVSYTHLRLRLPASNGNR